MIAKESASRRRAHEFAVWFVSSQFGLCAIPPAFKIGGPNFSKPFWFRKRASPLPTTDPRSMGAGASSLKIFLAELRRSVQSRLDSRSRPKTACLVGSSPKCFPISSSTQSAGFTHAQGALIGRGCAQAFGQGMPPRAQLAP